jgi:outer membrane protein assembly factor BamB
MNKPVLHLIGLAGLQLFLLASTSASVGAVEWPQFRGPSGDGHVLPAGSKDRIGLPLEWSETNHVKWKTEIPERGWSSPVVMGDQIWLTTATLDGHEFFGIAVDAATGKIQYREKLFTCEKPEPLGNSVNCYATPTSAIEPGRVYLHFGSYGTACLDTATRQVLWKRDDLRCRHYRGPASSPILYQDTVILSMDGADLQYLVALDKKTGKTVWKTDRSVVWNDEDIPDQMTRDGDRRKAHSTPLIVPVNGKPMMFTTGAKAAYGYDPGNGQELWRVQYNAWSAAPVPVYDAKSGLALLITGLGKTELLGVRVDGRGDVTDTHIAWRTDVMVAKTASPLLIDGLLYMVSDDGMLTCLEAATGAQVWRQRIGGNYSASPIYADGQMFFFSQQGRTSVIRPGRTFELTGTNALGSGFMASPAVSGKALFLRSKTHLYRVESD